MEISKGKWQRGKPHGTVVTDNGEGFPEGYMSKESLDFYGGYLIAESIGKVADQDLIIAAPEIYEALTELIPFAAEFINDNHPAMKKAKAALGKIR